MIPPQFMKLSVKLFYPAYHNLTVHIIIVYEEILRVKNWLRSLISSRNKSKGTTQPIET